MKILKLFICFNVFLILSILNSEAQETMTIKTNELYLLELPSSQGNYTHSEIFATWNFDFDNKKITNRIPELGLITINCSNIELNKNSTEDNIIFHFENSQEQVTLILKSGNFLKIIHSTDKKPNSNPASYRNMKVYSNYVINDFWDLLKF